MKKHYSHIIKIFLRLAVTEMYDSLADYLAFCSDYFFLT